MTESVPAPAPCTPPPAAALRLARGLRRHAAAALLAVACGGAHAAPDAVMRFLPTAAWPPARTRPPRRRARPPGRD